MTTIKEYKKIKQARVTTDALMNGLPIKMTGEIMLVSGNDVHEYADKLIPNIIRVIELAEEALLSCQITLENYEAPEPFDLEKALSEIRKLKGE